MQSIKKQFNASLIQVLDELEAVRKRPVMNIGDSSIKSLHYLVSEVVDNCIDEALASYSHGKMVLILPDNSIKETDSYPDIQEDIHQEEQRSALEVITTVIHTSRKNNKNTHKVSSSLHSVGANCDNICCLFAGCGGFDQSVEPTIMELAETIVSKDQTDIVLQCQDVIEDNSITLTHETVYTQTASTGDDAVPIVVSTQDIIYINKGADQTIWFDAGRSSGGIPNQPLPTKKARHIIHNKFLEYPPLITPIISAGECIDLANSKAA